MSDNYDMYDDDEGPIDLSEIDGPVHGSSEFGPVDIGEVDLSEIGEADAADPDSINAPQHMLLSYLNGNHKLWIRCSPIIEDTFFDQSLQPVVALLRSFEHQNHKMPNPIIIRADTGVSLDELDDAHDPNVEEFIANRVEEFCRSRAAEEFLWESSEILDKDRTRGTMAHGICTF